MPKPANKRGAARLSAVQALYQMDIGGAGLTQTVAEYENFRLGQEVDGEAYLDAESDVEPEDLVVGWFQRQHSVQLTALRPTEGENYFPR